LGRAVGILTILVFASGFEIPAKVDPNICFLDWLHPMLKSRRVWLSKHKARVADSPGST
jgi:hypothetical protein